MTANTKPIVLSDYREAPITGKKIEIILFWGDWAKAYRVVSIKNTTWYQPKMWLSTSIVSKLCELPDWTVLMIEDTLVKDILHDTLGHMPAIGIP